MNMFKSTKATSVKEYLDAVPKERHELVMSLHDFIKKSVPKLKVHFANNMIGYGSFPYKNYKKEKIEWPTVALACQKNYVSIYVCSIVDGHYVAETYKKDLGKVKVGRSCISLSKIEDVNLTTLKKVLQMAEKHPGLVT